MYIYILLLGRFFIRYIYIYTHIFILFLLLRPANLFFRLATRSKGIQCADPVHIQRASVNMCVYIYIYIYTYIMLQSYINMLHEFQLYLHYYVVLLVVLLLYITS